MAPRDGVNFNSHAHVERDDKVVAANAETINFNSHAHVERDAKARYAQHRFDISTHTLTWSVTLSAVSFWYIITYFNSHAHVERDTTSQQMIQSERDFNSHAHVERDIF